MEKNSQKKLYRFNTQPVLNYFFINKVKDIDKRWNTKNLGNGSNKDLENAFVLHWNGPRKPWKNNGLYKEYWDKYSYENNLKEVNDYVENKIFNKDPFISIDERGVGELIKIATERGREKKKNLKLGICGEHGGDPKSIDFCSRTGLDYVSCSPFRVPVARLAAAQAELRK